MAETVASKESIVGRFDRLRPRTGLDSAIRGPGRAGGLSTNIQTTIVAIVLAVANAPRWDLLTPALIELTDPSWRVALHQIAHENVLWGPEVVNTLGPLAFVGYPIPAYSETFWAALAAFSIGHMAATVATLMTLRRWLPVGWAVAATWFVVRLCWNPLFEAALFAEAMAALFALLCFNSIVLRSSAKPASRLVESPSPKSWTAETTALVIGCGSAVMMLIKLSAGLQAIAVGTLTIAAISWMASARWLTFARSATAWFVGLTASYLGLWVLLGQPIGNVVSYLVSALDMASGYASAMGWSETGAGWGVRSGLALSGVVSAIALFVARDRGVVQMGLCGAPMAAFVFFLFKLGFVRADWTHVMPFALSIAVGVLAFAGHGSTRVPAVVACVLATVMGWLALSASPGAAQTASLSNLVVSTQNIADGLDRLNLLVDSGDRRETIGEFERVTEERISLRPSIRRVLAGQTVHVDPVETSQLWSLQELEWGSPPVFQSYLAYTPKLDTLNADWLRDSDTAPRFILRTPFAIDFRERAGENPEYLRAMVCNYQEMASQPQGWPVNGRTYVLERTSPRCGEIRELSSSIIEFDEALALPSQECQGLMVYRVGGFDTSGQRLRGTLYRDAFYGIDFGGTPQRFVPLTASSWQLMPGLPLPAWVAPPSQSEHIRFASDAKILGAGNLEVSFGCMPFDERVISSG